MRKSKPSRRQRRESLIDLCITAGIAIIGCGLLSVIWINIRGVLK